MFITFRCWNLRDVGNLIEVVYQISQNWILKNTILWIEKLRIKHVHVLIFSKCFLFNGLSRCLITISSRWMSRCLWSSRSVRGSRTTSRTSSPAPSARTMADVLRPDRPQSTLRFVQRRESTAWDYGRRLQRLLVYKLLRFSKRLRSEMYILWGAPESQLFLSPGSLIRRKPGCRFWLWQWTWLRTRKHGISELRFWSVTLRRSLRKRKDVSYHFILIFGPP